ncbi:ATP-dependent zinc protease family protein [Ferrimonas futtsuensis]|uniref:ATP-dependent zinc protease family protein n=1 Tax=Ferrimonas futtsuensis TaxID=364764 RepID=UPI0004258E7E|nr:RimK/LysX family protein [Ferrimonas futtsuensis]
MRIAVCLLLMSLWGSGAMAKELVAAVERVHLGPGAIDFMARVDTGAAISSLHATDVRLLQSGNQQQVRFVTENHLGEQLTLTLPVVDTMRVRSAQGSERRYVVLLPVGFRGTQRAIKVNLKNRGHMAYRLLLGRNWLSGYYLVDVDRPTSPE